MISLLPYHALLASPTLRYLFLASIIGRLPIGMTGLAILLLVQGASGSFVDGGAATGCYVAGLACAAPALGRLIDRRGPRTLLWVCSILFPVALAGLIGAVKQALPAALVLVCAAGAGACFPPITVCMRTYLRQRLADEGALTTAYSLDSVLIESIFIVGPMLVAFFVAFSSAAAAVSFAAGCSLVGVILFLRASALRGWHIEARTYATALGPLADAGFSALVGIVVCYALAFGFTEIGVAAYAAEAGSPASAGVFLGLMSAGSAAGGLAYGSRSWHGPLLRQFGWTLGIMGIGLAVLAAPWEPIGFGVLSIGGGILMAPALIIQSMLVAKTARAEHMTEAFTWSSSALLAGVGAGMAFGGALVEWWRSPAAFAAAGLAAMVAAGAALWLARR